MNMITAIFIGILNTSIRASLIAVLIFCVKKIFDRFISARLHYVLWFFVFIGLLMPILPKSQFSIFNILNLSRVEYEAQQIIEQEESIVNNLDAKIIINKIDREAMTENDNPKGSINPIEVVAALWFLVFLIITFLFTRSMSMVHKRISIGVPIDSEIVLSTLNRCRNELGIEKSIDIYRDEGMDSPCIIGLANPSILLPSYLIDAPSKEGLYHIIMHELAHYRRKDYIGNVLRAVVLALHWFNPIIWIALRAMRRDMELACDSYVLEAIGEVNAIGYGKTILGCIRLLNTSRLQPSILFFPPTHDQYERRIMMIKRFKQGRYKITFMTVLVLAAIAVIIGTNASDVGVNVEASDGSFNVASSDSVVPGFIKDKVVVIDPGHGGDDLGAIANDMNEKDINLEIAKNLKVKLQDYGVKAYLTRDDDIYVKLSDRAAVANNLEADMFVSIHIGASADEDVKGVVGAYNESKGRNNQQLADILTKALVEKLGTDNLGVQNSDTLVVLKETTMPAALLDIGLLTNSEEAELIREDRFKEDSAEALFNGIVEYFELNNHKQ